MDASKLTVSVIDIIREMGFEPTRWLTLKVGTAMRKWYFTHHGELPRKELRRKTNGVGTHCIAVYPAYMRRVIAGKVREATP